MNAIFAEGRELFSENSRLVGFSSASGNGKGGGSRTGIHDGKAMRSRSQEGGEGQRNRLGALAHSLRRQDQESSGRAAPGGESLFSPRKGVAIEKRGGPVGPYVSRRRERNRNVRSRKKWPAILLKKRILEQWKGGKKALRRKRLVSV